MLYSCRCQHPRPFASLLKVFPNIGNLCEAFPFDLYNCWDFFSQWNCKYTFTNIAVVHVAGL
ncbi:hypothetical protein MPLDJ20_20120 [Mesorhizobium plurifarium]|uniref:Uncharacterized protein n=1 Tax=Mesorhizobium plurifarium TaxID=69974 RepID=A0A090GKE1_MESPL|nr:hypothetical protein MPLDJ20_20120 [Mesorhizobium plurifarium]